MWKLVLWRTFELYQPKQGKVIGKVIQFKDILLKIQEKKENFEEEFFELVYWFSKWGHNTLDENWFLELRKACNIISTILYEIDEETEYYIPIFKKNIDELNLENKFIKTFIYILLQIIDDDLDYEDELIKINMKDYIDNLTEIDEDFRSVSKYIDIIIKRIKFLYAENILQINLNKYK